MDPKHAVWGKEDKIQYPPVRCPGMHSPRFVTEKKKIQGFVRSQKLKVCVLPSQNMYPLKKCIRLNTFPTVFFFIFIGVWLLDNVVLIFPVQQMGQPCVCTPCVWIPFLARSAQRAGWHPLGARELTSLTHSAHTLTVSECQFQSPSSSPTSLLASICLFSISVSISALQTSYLSL